MIGSRKFREKLAVIIWFWLSNVCVVWKVRNGVIFSQKGLEWVKVAEESKYFSWKILKT